MEAPEQMDTQNVANQISVIRDEVSVMGANGSEIPNLNRVLERLQRGEISPEKALAEATAIQARKSDYH